MKKDTMIMRLAGRIARWATEAKRTPGGLAP